MSRAAQDGATPAPLGSGVDVGALRGLRGMPAWLWMLPALLGCLLLTPVFEGWYRADDLLFAPFLEPGGPELQVAWDQVGAEFVRPSWRDAVRHYRPMIAVAYGVLLELGDGSAFAFQLANLVLLFVSSLLVGFVCARLAKNPWAGLLGVAVFAFHPVQGEVVGWPAAISAGLETCIRMGCVACYVASLSGRARFSWPASLVLHALSLATLESAAILPLSLLVVDLLHGPAALGPRLRRLGPHFALGCCYLVLRTSLVLFGKPQDSSFLMETLLRFPVTLPSKLRALFLPWQDALLLAVGAAALLVAVVACLRQLRGRRDLVVASLGFAWVCLHFVPSGKEFMAADLQGIRNVHPVVASAVFLGLPLLLRPGGAGSPWPRRAGMLALGVWVVCAIPSARTLLQREVRAERFVLTMQRQLLQHAANATPLAPLAVLGHPVQDPQQVEVLWQGGVHVLLQRPYARDDVPVVALDYVTADHAAGSRLRNDASVYRALRESGAQLVSWDAANSAFVAVPEPAAGAAHELVREPGSNHFRFAAGPQSAGRIEGLRLRLAGARREGRLRWSAPVPIPDALRECALPAPGPEGAVLVDLSRDLRFYALLELGVQGFELVGVPAEDVLSAEALERLPVLECEHDLDAWRSFDERLSWLPVPEASELELVLLGPGYGNVLEWDGKAWRFPEGSFAAFCRDLEISHQRRVYYFFRSPRGRSRLGCFRARVPRDE